MMMILKALISSLFAGLLELDNVQAGQFLSLGFRLFPDALAGVERTLLQVQNAGV